MNISIGKPDLTTTFMADHVALLRSSFEKLTGKELVPSNMSTVEAAHFLFDAPFAVISHNSDADPLFNYANRKAMQLFEMVWPEIIGLPSRMSVEPTNRDERTRLLKSVTDRGYIDGYSGIRISSSGRRFKISDAIVWNLTNEQGEYAGQAAMFDSWRFV
jgi:hypothetical protein